MSDNGQLVLNLKRDGMSAVDSHESDDWKTAADSAIAILAGRGVEFTAEDVRLMAGSPERPNSMGARLSANAKAGIIVPVGYKTGARPESHARAMRIWRGRK